MGFPTFTGPSGRCYHVHPDIQAQLDIPQNIDADIMPVLLLSLDAMTWTVADIMHTINKFFMQDDVFGSDFISRVLIIQLEREEGSDFSLKIQQSLSGAEVLPQLVWLLEKVLFVTPLSASNYIPPGPYFLTKNCLHQAWRLFEDNLEAFQTTVVQDSRDLYSFKILDGVASSGAWKVVAVPSRLYSTHSVSKPLAGKRLAVKDLYRLRGIRTALNVRSFLETYGPEEQTAEYVKVLIDLGAVVVGKTRMTAFAGGEKAPENWIDFQCPFNPRADGYQAPGGSTTGGTAALAGYEWLDYSIGTDTFASIREPAALHGIFGLRPTTGQSSSMEGIYASCRRVFDAVGLLARDLASLQVLASSSLYKTLSNASPYPRSILYPTDWLPSDDPGQREREEVFVKILENYLGVKRSFVNLGETWDRNPPAEAQGLGLYQYLKTTGYNLFYYDGYHEYAGFREQHQRKFGKPAYIGPRMRYIWNLGAAITAEARDQSMNELAVFRKWFLANILRPDPTTASTAIVVLPVGTGTPTYRDELKPPPPPRLSLDRLNFASLLSLPQLVIPIGQKQYHSRVTSRSEYLPIASSIAAAAGSELMLMNLARGALEAAGWPTAVRSGKFTFAAH